MTGEVFLDTACAIALAVASDRFNVRALELADQLEAERTNLVTTQGVLLEIGNALSRQRYRAAAVRLLRAMEADPNVETVPLSEELYVEAFRLYRQRTDKDWGLTDCVSFVVMRQRGIAEALTADEHFEQAGFVCLLRQ